MMNKHTIEDITAKYLVEERYEYDKWRQEIPPLHFKEEWNVHIIPPFHGAIVRFVVEYDDKRISCYLDCYDELGYYGSPYWEIYPYTYEDGNIDVFRCSIDNTEELMKRIGEELKRDV